MIHVLDSQTETILATLENKVEAALYWNDIHEDTLKNNQETFDFTMLATVPAAEHVSKRNLIIIPDEDGHFREFIIRETYQFDRKKEVRCFASFVEIAKQKIIDPIVLEGQTIQTAANYVLPGTDWQLGIAEGLSLRKVEFTEHTDALKALRMIASIFGLELRFRVVTKANKIIARYVDFILRDGSFKGKEIELGKDLIGIKRHESSDVYTALIGLGPEREDGTRLIVRVEDKAALQRWGKKGRHLWGVYIPESSDLDLTEERLTDLTRTELEKRINTTVQYEAEAASIEHILGYEHEKVRKGDSVRIKDTSYIPPLYLDARIISVKRAISNKSKKSFILGDFIEYTEEEIMATFKALNAVLRKKASAADIEAVKEYADQVAETAEGNAKEYAQAIAVDLSEVERLKGHKVQIYKELSSVHARYEAINNHPQMYTQPIKEELIASKENLDEKYNALVTSINSIVADNVILPEERQDSEAKTEEYRMAIQRFETAYATAQADIADGKASDAERASTDFVETYANKRITQGSMSPSNPVTDDLWIDTSVTPYVWKRWDGTDWIKAISTTLGELEGTLGVDQLAANTVEAVLIKAGGMDAAVLKAGTIISKDVIFTGELRGVTGVFSGAVQVFDSQYGRRAWVEKGYVRADNGDGMGRVAIMQDGLFAAFNDDTFSKVEMNGSSVIGVSYNPYGVQGEIARINFSEDFLEISAYNKVKIHGYVYEPLTEGNMNRYLWSGLNWNEIGSTLLGRADSTWNAPNHWDGGYPWHYMNTYGHDSQFAWQDAMHYSGNQRATRVKEAGQWRPWKYYVIGRFGVSRAYQYASTRASVTVNHGLGRAPENVQLTIRWVSGAISLDNVRSVYVENINATSFTIAIAGVNFAPGQWIDVDWVATQN